MKVGDRSDWETCCVPSLIEFEVDGIQLPKKDNPNTIVSLGEVTTSLVSLAFGPSIQNVEAALAQVVIQGPATGPAVIEYKAQSYARSSPKLFVGSLAAVGEDKKVQVLRFLAEFGRTGGPPEKIADSYKEKSYFVLDLGSGSTVYNTIQMDESARVARTVNDRVLKVLKASLAPLADLGEIAVSGVRVDMKILSRNFANRGAEPSIDALQIYAPRELVRKFADADITSQQLMDGCVVLVNDNRVQVLLGAGAR